MSTFRLGIGALLLAVGCTPIDPAPSTFPQQPEPTQVSGPPGGYVDPGYGYQPQPAAASAYAGDQPGYPQGYAQGYPEGYQGGYAPSTEDQAAAGTAAGDPEPSATPGDAGYDMGDVTDTEIDATLDGYGSWQESDDYGRIWRPDTTTVGVDFTPYETDGSWIWSDAGWNYSCDYNWGWLPFHYGRWGWFDGYWGWQPGYNWTAAAVEWRGGGGYTGWRPLGPVVRDHRHPETGNGHRGGELRDSQWRFAADKDFGHGHIRGHLFQNPAEGLRATATIARPTLRGNYAPVSSASLMRGRISSQAMRNNASPTFRNTRPAPQAQQGFRQQGFRPQPSQAPYRGTTPTWRAQPQQTYRPQPQQTYRPQPQQTDRPQYQAPQQTYRPQPQQTYRPQYQPPQRTYQAPSRSYNSGPSRPQYTAPSRSYTPSRSYSAPSSGGGGGSRPSSGGGHSSGGGGRHR